MVLDASVILKWFFENEAGVEAAWRIYEDYERDKVQIAVCSHTFTEVMNILALKSPRDAMKAFSFLMTAEFLECTLGLNTCSQGLRLMRELEKISFYDAIYHATALHHDGIFVTADEKYYEKARHVGGVVLLEEYGSSEA